MAIDKAVDSVQLEADLTSVADKIRAKADITDKLEFPEGFNSALDEIISVYEAPTQTKSVTITENGIYPIMPDKEYFAMDFVGLTVNVPSADEALAEVEYALSNGYTDYSYMFYGKTLTTEVPEGLLRHTSTGVEFTNMFYGCENLLSVPPLNIISCGETITGMFYKCKSLTTIPTLNTKNAKTLQRIFMNCEALKTIEGIDLTNAIYVNYLFQGCTSLENITFNGSIRAIIELTDSPKLTHDSLMSAINALRDYVSEGSTESWQLRIGSTNKAKLTEDDLYIATSKGWNVF